MAVAAARLGARSAFIGKVGDDAFGRFLIETLEQEGVITRGMRVAEDARTTMAFIAKPDAHSAEYVFYRNPGADMRLCEADIDDAYHGAARAFHFGSISLHPAEPKAATLKALAIAKRAGQLVSYDPNYRPALWPSPDLARDEPQSVDEEIGQIQRVAEYYRHGYVRAAEEELRHFRAALETEPRDDEVMGLLMKSFLSAGA